MCVCRATDYTGETTCSLFPAYLHFLFLSHFLSLSLNLCLFFPCMAHTSALHLIPTPQSFAVQGIIFSAGSVCITQTFEGTHTYTYGVPPWVHCSSAKGFPMIKASLLLVQVLKKLKQKGGGGGLRGMWSDSKLTSSSCQSRMAAGRKKKDCSDGILCMS